MEETITVLEKYMILDVHAKYTLIQLAIRLFGTHTLSSLITSRNSSEKADSLIDKLVLLDNNVRSYF